MDDELFLNERIKVLASFGEGLNICYPMRFWRANGREVVVKKLGLRHPTNAGLRTIHVFEVTDGGTDYRLEFDTERLTWHLTREMDHYDAA